MPVTIKANPELTMAIFIDLKKAFETISHELLLQKLKRYSIREISSDFIHIYLTNRKQYVNYDNQPSKVL